MKENNEDQQYNQLINKAVSKIQKLENEIELKLEKIKSIENVIYNHYSYTYLLDIKLKVESFEKSIKNKRLEIVKIENEAEKDRLESINLMTKSQELLNQSRKKKLHSDLLLERANNMTSEINRILHSSKCNGIHKEEKEAKKIFNQFSSKLKRDTHQLKNKIKSIKKRIDMIKRYKGDS